MQSKLEKRVGQIIGEALGVPPAASDLDIDTTLLLVGDPTRFGSNLALDPDNTFRATELAKLAKSSVVDILGVLGSYQAGTIATRGQAEREFMNTYMRWRAITVGTLAVAAACISVSFAVIAWSARGYFHSNNLHMPWIKESLYAAGTLSFLFTAFKAGTATARRLRRRIEVPSDASTFAEIPQQNRTGSSDANESGAPSEVSP